MQYVPDIMKNDNGYRLPARVNMKGQIRGASDTDGGWAVFQCESFAHAQEIMAAYPRAEMPCWRRLRPGGDLFAKLAGV